MEPINNVVHEAKLTPLSKRIKLGQANPVMNVKPDNVLKQPDVVRHEVTLQFLLLYTDYTQFICLSLTYLLSGC